MTQAHPFPPMPEIGRPETHYARLLHAADKASDPHAHEAAKVGQYVTLALDPMLTWDEKLKYFRHALKRHCQPPPFPDDTTWMYYRNLSEIIRHHAGAEALRIASTEDDLYAARLSMGQERHKIEDEAELFFARLLGSEEKCPEHFNVEDWQQLRLIRNQWV